MSIRKYFENIADAIKTKGGTSTALTPAEMPRAILDLPTGSSTASGVTYDNTAGGLTANNVQDAIDELAEGVSTINSDLSELPTHKQSGSGIDDLIALVSSLTDDQFYRSRLLMYDMIMNPFGRTSTNASYSAIDIGSSKFVQYYFINNGSSGEYFAYSVPLSGGSRTKTTQTVSTWALFY